MRFYREPGFDCQYPDTHIAISPLGPMMRGGLRSSLKIWRPAEQGDQLLGCDFDSARSAVINLAGLHGPRWCDPTLVDVVPYRSAEETAFLASVVAESTAGFIAHYGDRVDAEDVLVLQAFAPKCGTWLVDNRDRFAPVHGDYRLDNLLFGKSDDGGVECISRRLADA